MIGTGLSTGGSSFLGAAGMSYDICVTPGVSLELGHMSGINTVPVTPI